MFRIMALDYGTVRIGIALSDAYHCRELKLAGYGSVGRSKNNFDVTITNIDS